MQRYGAAFRDGGLEDLRRRDVAGPVSEMAAYGEVIRASLQAAPARSIAEAGQGTQHFTGLNRSPAQVRKFIKGLGLKWRRMRAVPRDPMQK